MFRYRPTCEVVKARAELVGDHDEYLRRHCVDTPFIIGIPSDLNRKDITNVITNNSFETGDLTGWTVANGTADTGSRENSNGTHIERLYRLIDGKAEAIEFIARRGDPYIGIPLKDISTKQGSLVSVIVRQGKIIIPFGMDHIEEGDHVIIVSRNLGISDLNEVLKK